MHNVVVIGAGVVGLTNALEIKRAFPDVSITIVAKNLPGDLSPEYTSPYAGANWESFAEDDDKELQEMDALGYHRLSELADEPASGIWRKENVIYLDEKTFRDHDSDPHKAAPWYKTLVRNFRTLKPHELPQDAVWGFSYGGLVITVPVYLHYLLSQCFKNGIVVKRTTELKTVQQARELHSNGWANTVINCTGILVSRLGGFKDERKLYGVLGQVLVTRNNLEKITVFDMFDPDYPEEIPYIFPRKEGGCIIGGCFRKDFRGPICEDKQLTERIVERATRLVPQLVDPNYKNNPGFIDVVLVNVGLRPFREMGRRIEADPEHEWLIHSYGVGAGGYQGSYGFAHKVVLLLRERITRDSAVEKKRGVKDDNPKL